LAEESPASDELPNDSSRGHDGHQNHESGAQPLGISKRQLQLAAEDASNADIGTAPDHDSQRIDRKKSKYADSGITCQKPRRPRRR